MKKNCFIYTVIFGTILIGSSIYIFNNYFSELFLEEGKKIVVSEIENNWKKELAYVKNSSEKDSLRILIKEFVMQFDEPSNFLLSSQVDEIFVESIAQSFDDSLITKKELKWISDLFLKVKNEKHKSN
jgi:vacuolar-type H+-ATPase subunit E/Vma4